ncbi:hypothetical protein Tco_1120985 [Tanacetum coccineum]|uniref:Uncharacterized protein n=1 Tax=Tanacetum coccineum TaxID=301880 RepID=A0ABQ5IXV4_9ASTR
MLQVQVVVGVNTWVVSELQDILPRILNQLGPDSLRNLAEQFKQQQGVGAGEGATPMPAIQEDYTLTFTYLELQDYQL